jgi:hypothetical protein
MRCAKLTSAFVLFECGDYTIGFWSSHCVIVQTLFLRLIKRFETKPISVEDDERRAAGREN